jgi:hypothetical protein
LKFELLVDAVEVGMTGQVRTGQDRAGHYREVCYRGRGRAQKYERDLRKSETREQVHHEK